MSGTIPEGLGQFGGGFGQFLRLWDSLGGFGTVYESLGQFGGCLELF